MEKGSITSLNWGTLAARGIMAKLFALCFFVYPAIPLKTRILSFAIFALVYGIISIWSTLGSRVTGIMALEFLQGLLSITIGLIALFFPGLTNPLLLFFIAAWVILIGVFKIILATLWSREIPHRWLPKISGIMAILLGLFLIMFQLSDKNILVFSFYIGAYLFIFGILYFVFALDLRAFQKKIRNV